MPSPELWEGMGGAGVGGGGGGGEGVTEKAILTLLLFREPHLVRANLSRMLAVRFSGDPNFFGGVTTNIKV